MRTNGVMRFVTDKSRDELKKLLGVFLFFWRLGVDGNGVLADLGKVILFVRDI